MRSCYRFLLLLAVSNFLPICFSWATHLRAGDITVERVSCASNTFRITIIAYTNTSSTIRFSDHGTGVLDFGDGTQINPPEQAGTPRPDLGQDIGIVVFTVEHIFGAGQHKITYREANRNSGILNVFDSVNTPFFLETIINVDPFFGCDNSPKLLVPPLDKACTGAAWFHNPGAYDIDGDSLSYELTIPRQDKDETVNNYRSPAAKEFYDRVGLSFATANETHSGPPTFTINSRTGTIIWDAPGAPGQYNIAFLIKEWRRLAGTWVLLGSVTRDMQIIVEDCRNKRPQLDPVKDVCVEAGKTLTQDVFGFDPDSDSVKIEAFSEVFSITPSAAIWSSNPARYQSSAPSKKAVLKFKWDTRCEHVKDNAYQVVFKITDKPKVNTGPPLTQFITWNIKVVAPAPQWRDTAIDPASASANLKWNAYACQRAEKMEVWRRVDKVNYTPPECVTGMPGFLGYEKIAEVPVSQSQYKDTNDGKGLARGAQYCYRLVAVFPLPGGGESYVSRDTCIAPLPVDATVITHVTVDKTDVTNGQITVRWTPPFEIDKTLFPPPYVYEVYRADDFSGSANLKKIHTGRLTDTAFTDTGIDTENKVFNYRIVAYDSKAVKLDTSATASSVRLDAKSQLKKIQLSWSFNVPWSNNTAVYPRHSIYRGAPGQPEDQMTLIDNVDVRSGAYVFSDSGQYNNMPLKENEKYCYRVETRGAYGHPDIMAPLLNFSQVICAQPKDTIPPCTPQINVVVKGTRCEEYVQSTSCNPTLFSNTITWGSQAAAGCNDIRFYRVYLYSDSETEKGTLLADNVRDTFYIDHNIPSFARCYRVAAVDRSDNESELSEMFCFDNCPYYELPNIFTPNGDDCNELFSAYSDRDVLREGESNNCGADPNDQRRRCARFVQKVHFTVVNRWGKQVYDYVSGNERSIYIDWNGRDNNGKELSSGVYYYVAEVTFDVVNPSQRVQTLRGWVHLIR